MSHSIEVSGVPDDLLTRLDQRVEKAGCDRASYIVNLLSRDLDECSAVEETVALFRQQVEESGISDAEFDELIEAARVAAYHHRQAEGCAVR